MEVMKKRPEYQKLSCELYDIKPMVGKPLELIMREAYLDFYSKSLQLSNTDGFAYSKRLQKEQKEHNVQLEKILKEGNAGSDYDKDPILTKDELEPKKSSFKLGDDGMFLEKDDKKDESTNGIAGRIIEKLKQNKEASQEDAVAKPSETEAVVKSSETEAVDEEIKNLEKVKELIEEKIQE
jgi:hypothetical protein